METISGHIKFGKQISIFDLIKNKDNEKQFKASDKYVNKYLKKSSTGVNKKIF
ncbi:hypothetical protein ACXAT6_003376 [Clostridium sporogenes]|uniref:hypothetical protein n=1 Tax=Clostridium sporogenes TaxID=1509 RepID=UPI003F91CB3A